MTINEYIVSIAESQLGVIENPSGSNAVKYNDWYYGRSIKGESYAWCVVFAEWVYDAAGHPLEKRTNNVNILFDWYKANRPEMVKDVKAGKPGSIIIFNKHLGLVKKAYDGKQYVTIEGNTSNGVFQRTRKLSDVYGIIHHDEYDRFGVNIMGDAELEKFILATVKGHAEELYRHTLDTLNIKSSSAWAEADARKAVESGIFGDSNGDKMLDYPQAPLTRQEFASVLNRLGLLDRKGGN